MKNYACRFNALRLTVFGDLEPVWVEDFSTSRGLGAAIGFGCERINAVSTRRLQELSALVGFPLIGYVDAYGYDKNHVPNRLLQGLSGYDLLLGPGILCLWRDNDYAPLETGQVEALVRTLTGVLDMSPGKARAALAPFRLAGQAEYEAGMKLCDAGDFAQAHSLFASSARLGCPDGMNALAYDHLWGEGVPEDKALGLRLMEQAAEAGSAKALRNLGIYHLFGQHGLPEDHQKALDCLQAAAMENDPSAMTNLAYMYAFETYGCENTAKAAYWLQRALAYEDTEAWLYLGMLIAEDKYYSYQPRYVRYCFEQYARTQNFTLEQVIALSESEEIADELYRAEPMKPHYPKVPQAVIRASAEDPCQQFCRGLELLESRAGAREGMELVLEAADTGYVHAGALAAFYLMDFGQEDSFRYKANGEVDAFPVDSSRSMGYLRQAALQGSETCLRVLPFMGLSLGEAKEYLQLYIALSGDWTVEQYILPNLQSVLEYDEGLPWLSAEDFEAAQAATAHLCDHGAPICDRVDILERSVDPENQQAIDTMLEYYRFILRIQA